MPSIFQKCWFLRINLSFDFSTLNVCPGHWLAQKSKSDPLLERKFNFWFTFILALNFLYNHREINLYISYRSWIMTVYSWLFFNKKEKYGSANKGLKSSRLIGKKRWEWPSIRKQNSLLDIMVLRLDPIIKVSRLKNSWEFLCMNYTHLLIYICLFLTPLNTDCLRKISLISNL